ncbi:hypothetical protein HDU81_006357 [Chytriomyces hyalinus]|nr:hypothetical protein HDU81_006357 [Chytriomyces hyalinus]
MQQLMGFESIDNLIDVLNDNGAECGWGSTDFLGPLGEILSVQFITYSPHLDGGQDSTLHPQFRALGGNLEIVHLQYSNNHFEAVVKRDAMEHPMWPTMMIKEDAELQNCMQRQAVELQAINPLTVTNFGMGVEPLEHLDQMTPARTTGKKPHAKKTASCSGSKKQSDKKTPSPTAVRKVVGTPKLRRSKRLQEAQVKKMMSAKGVGVGVRGT